MINECERTLFLLSLSTHGKHHTETKQVRSRGKCAVKRDRATTQSNPFTYCTACHPDILLTEGKKEQNTLLFFMSPKFVQHNIYIQAETHSRILSWAGIKALAQLDSFNYQVLSLCLWFQFLPAKLVMIFKMPAGNSDSLFSPVFPSH